MQSFACRRERLHDHTRIGARIATPGTARSTAIAARDPRPGCSRPGNRRGEFGKVFIRLSRSERLFGRGDGRILDRPGSGRMGAVAYAEYDEWYNGDVKNFYARVYLHQGEQQRYSCSLRG